MLFISYIYKVSTILGAIIGALTALILLSEDSPDPEEENETDL